MTVKLQTWRSHTTLHVAATRAECRGSMVAAEMTRTEMQVMGTLTRYDPSDCGVHSHSFMMMLIDAAP